MDLNELYYQHQRAIMNVRAGAGGEERETCSDLVEHYAKRIRECRRESGASGYLWAM